MAEPAELLLVKDQYQLALHSLSLGLSAEEAGKKSEALEYYEKGRRHLTQGLEVPTGGDRHVGAHWDTARQLQLKMRDTLRNVGAHLSDLESSAMTTEDQRGQLLMELPHLYPNLAPNSQPPHSSLHHLYPTVPAAIQNPTPPPSRPLHRPVLPAALRSPKLPSEALGTKPGDHPPVYTSQPKEGHCSLAYGPAGQGLVSGQQPANAAGVNGNELLFIPSGVQMFFVAPNGQVSSLFSPGFLRIVILDGQQKDSSDGRPSAFLHVCNCLYPLTADTPVLLANSGIFMFPDTLANTPGSFVGIVLSSELPAALHEAFQDLLLQLADLRVQAPGEGAGSEVINLSEKIPLGPPVDSEVQAEKQPVPVWSKKMSHNILSGTSWLSRGVVKGADATSKAIHKGAAKLRDHMTPEETPSEVSPGVHKGLHVTKQATGGAVRVSKFLVNGVSTVMGHVADKVVPHVKKQGAKLVPESMKKRKDGEPSNLDGVKLVVVSSAQGFSTVWAALESGAKQVGKSVTSETVTTVQYKYGDDAGKATDTAMQSLVNVGVTAYNIDNLGKKALLKTAGKQTAKAMVKDKKGQTAESQEQQTEKQGQQKNAKRLRTEEGEKKK